MFYRIKNDDIYDYADYQYDKDCLQTDLCTMTEYISNPGKFIVADITENIDGELITKKRLIINPEWNNMQIQKREADFKKQFFETSLGWIRRSVHMKDGSVKDFLGDLLIPVKIGLELGQNVEIITYKYPDFSIEPDNEYMECLQEVKGATLDFIKECLMQTVKDFGLKNGGENGISN